MDSQTQTVLQAAVLLLQQFLEPDEETVMAILAEAGLSLDPDGEDWQVTLTRALRPRDGDYARVFRGDAAEQARRGYEELWSSDPVIRPLPQQLQLQVTAAPAGLLSTDPDAADAFPGGYRDIAARLVPECCWVCWEFLIPGQQYGTQHNGLVYLDGRFAWFPKPWRVLEP